MDNHAIIVVGQAYCLGRRTMDDCNRFVFAGDLPAKVPCDEDLCDSLMSDKNEFMEKYSNNHFI